ncbi:hypothetical protein CCR75_006260 [Bremia lactucae]|uniref:Uncharacterized protein n=1 Tax=Bremia lactucae TaxID=4779 RepID=A0A976IFF0_BRELC|nr:hypothetical protein CCR75_006260 [Bremia lactucae]
MDSSTKTITIAQTNVSSGSIWGVYKPQIGKGLHRIVEDTNYVVAIKPDTECNVYGGPLINPLCAQFRINLSGTPAVSGPQSAKSPAPIDITGLNGPAPLVFTNGPVPSHGEDSSSITEERIDTSSVTTEAPEPRNESAISDDVDLDHLPIPNGEVETLEYDTDYLK